MLSAMRCCGKAGSDDKHDASGYKQNLVFGFIALALLSGASLVVLIPPYQVPDEPMHFRRVLAVMKGDFVGSVSDGQVGSLLPANLPLFEQTHLRDMIGNPHQPYPTDRLGATLHTQPSDDVAFLSYATSAVFSPLPYVIPATFAAASIASGAGLLPALWISRTGNLLLGCFLMWLAIRKAPDLTELLVLLGLLPMFMFLRSSVSADVLTISASWLFVSIVIDEFASDRENTWQKAACAALLILTKPLFLLVTLLGLVRPLTRRQWRSTLFLCASIVFSGLIAAEITASVLVPIRSDVDTDPKGQIIRTVREAPEVASLLVRQSIKSAPRYAVEAIGRFGWLDTPLPGPAAVLIAALLLITSVTARAAGWLTLRLRVIFLLVGLAGFFAVLWSNFVLWTPASAVDIEGAQGRHFLPLAPLFLITVMGLTERTGMRWRGRLVWFGMFFSCAITIWVIVGRYWL